MGPGLEGEVLRSRIEREESSLRSFVRDTRHKFGDMRELRSFLYTEHKAYSSSRLLLGHVEIDPKVKLSY